MGTKTREDPIPFWLAVEAFSPQPVSALSRSRDDVPFVGDYSSDQIPLPWLPEAIARDCPTGKEWEHSVYIGVFDVESAWAVLPSRADDNPNATSSQSAVMTMTVRQDGTLVDGSFVVSQCVWAVGKFLRNRSLEDVFSDFVAEEEAWKKQLDAVVVSSGISLSKDFAQRVPSHPVDKNDLSKLFQTIVRLAGVGRALTLAGSGMGLRVESRHVSSRHNQDAENKQDFLNSFFSRDLYELFTQNQRPKPVRRYLGSSPAQTIDISDNPEVVFDSVAPALIPDGRWPSDPTHALSLSQQFAVNRIFADLADSSDEILMLAASAACEKVAAASQASDSAVISTRANEQQKSRELQSLEEKVASAGAAMRRYAPTGRLPADDWFSADNREKEKAAPWLDKEFNDSRSLLFLAALDLHKSFIHDQRQVLKNNLFAAYDVLTNAVPSTAPAAAVRAAWESLFLLVPTITTTFASIPRLFASLGAEQLGWLIIDEAGQAAPQHALGGIWRTARALLVGDPLQLQPVVTLPIVHQQTLLELTGVSDQWLPGSNSAQALADRTCRYVARIDVPGSGEISVGAPLRVHRRCDNPMFDIVNNGVYGGMMVLAENNRESFMVGESTAPPSAWFDALGEHWNGHSSAEESILLSRLLGVLTASGHDMSKVLIVSPFRAVASEIRKVSRRFGVDIKRQAGTIHTAQGKEADIVILVLGGQTPGARSWAASSPNLFNVAVSRARRRLYVIGNRRNWCTLPYFQDLSAGVQHHDAGADLERLFGRSL